MIEIDGDPDELLIEEVNDQQFQPLDAKDQVQPERDEFMIRYEQ